MFRPYFITLFLIFALAPVLALETGTMSYYEQLSGIKVNPEGETFWDQKFDKKFYIFGKVPEKFLAENYHYITPGSTVLDIGMGEGRHAVYLAKKGLKVTGIDISTIAVKKASLLASEYGVRIKSIVGPIQEAKFAPNSFDAIICFYYVDRALNEKMVKWLRPGGVLIYESFTDNQRSVKEQSFHDPKYLLRPGELLKMFPDLRILKYEEPLHQKNFTASIILQKK